jgi:co-chaperonin GroES (HSP10)
MAKKLTRQYLPRTAREKEEQADAFAVLARMKRENSFASEAIEIEGASFAKVEKYVGPGLQRRGNDYVALPSDDLVRPPMLILDSKGVRPIEVRGSKASSSIGQYWNAVDDALDGNFSALRKFKGKKIPGTEIEFLTDVRQIHILQDAGQLENIKQIYSLGRRR